MSKSRDSDVTNVVLTSGLGDNDNEGEQLNLLSPVLPSPEEQRAIIGSIEAEGFDESVYVYTVSRAWYESWCVYVGLPTSSTSPASTAAADGSRHSAAGESLTPPSTRNVENGSGNSIRTVPASPAESRKASRTRCPSESTGSSSVSASDAAAVQPVSPGPIEMDLSSDDDNMQVDEKVWIKWASWYGVAETHELNRRRWTPDEREFEICVLSPYCGLLDNAVKTFDLTEQTGYIELQLRRVFRVAKHRKTRLWVCEKSRHARFQPLTDRSQELCFQECIDPNKNYILAVEVANLDGTWPTNLPGDPIGDFSVYRQLLGQTPPSSDGNNRTDSARTQSSGGLVQRSRTACRNEPTESTAENWEVELAQTLDTVFGGIAAELRETTAGIVGTAKCITMEREAELRSALAKLRDAQKRVEDQLASVARSAEEVACREASLVADRDKLQTDRAAFDGERQAFAEELVRMHTVNKIQDSRVKLNVGGHVFQTSTLTLTKDSDTMLAAMFSGRHALRQDDDGSFFIDRDGTHFRYILNFMRDGGCFRPGTLPNDQGFLTELLTEAEYYQVSGLVRLLNDHVRALQTANDESGSDCSEPAVVGNVRTTLTPSPLKTTPASPSIATTHGLSRAFVASPSSRRLMRKVSSQNQSEKS